MLPAEGEPADSKVRLEEFELTGDKLVAKAKELLREGNIRRIIIKNADGATLIEVPLTVGMAGVLAGAVMAPMLAALGAIAAVATKLKVVVERTDVDTPRE